MGFFQQLDTYFSNQGIRNFTNSKIHALVYMNPFGLGFFVSGRLYPLKMLFMLFSMGSHDIDTFIQF